MKNKKKYYELFYKAGSKYMSIYLSAESIEDAKKEFENDDFGDTANRELIDIREM